MYQVNPSAFDLVFAIPTRVVDEHIRLAGSVQLKVLLWFYRHAANLPDIDSLVEFIGLPKADVCDAITYWLDCGLLIESGKFEFELAKNTAGEPDKNKAEKDLAEDNKDKDDNIDKKEEPQKAKSHKTQDPVKEDEKAEEEGIEPQKAEKLPKIPLVRPNMQQVAARLEESEDLRAFFMEAQNILGRTLGFDAQVSLLMVHDHYGLPPSVILMICEYARSHNKQNSMSYILKFAEKWAEQEIDTFEKATDQLARLEQANAMWGKLKVMAGISTPKPTMRQQEYLSVWVGDWNFSIDMIFAAYEAMAEKTGGLSFSYINKVLQNWHKAGAKNLDEVEKINSERSLKFKEAKSKGSKATKTTGQSKANAGKSSYDLDEAERKAHYEPLIYKKKGD